VAVLDLINWLVQTIKSDEVIASMHARDYISVLSIWCMKLYDHDDVHNNQIYWRCDSSPENANNLTVTEALH
jgi:hypothetical protein